MRVGRKIAESVREDRLDGEVASPHRDYQIFDRELRVFNVHCQCAAAAGLLQQGFKRDVLDAGQPGEVSPLDRGRALRESRLDSRATDG